MRFNNSIDERNKQLLSDLESNGVQIDFEEKPEFQSWAVQARQRFGIVAPNSESSPESLAHELLHIKMNVLGFIPSNTITDIFKSNNSRFDIGDFSLIQNNLAHLRMLPEFVSMGYDMNLFVQNDGEEFLQKDLVPSILKFKIEFDSNKSLGFRQSIQTITLLIKILIEIKQFEIQNLISKTTKIDTDELLKMLAESDQELVNSIFNQITAWVDSGTYFNYDFYYNLNLALEELGYPTKENWSDWQFEN
jgi:hypothetical protein